MRTAFFPAHDHQAAQDWLAWDWLLWSGLWLLAVFISRATDIDMTVARAFYDPLSQSFPLRHDWLWSSVLHVGVKNLVTLTWVLLLAATLQAWRQGHLSRYEPLVFTLVTSAFAIFINGQLKSHSAHSCPWSLNGLGGGADYFRLLAATPANPGPGRCLPSGHAGVAFMWWPAVYACARWRPQWRWPAALAVLAFGLFCGYVQVARGAHFPSHVLIAAAVCGGVSSLAYRLPLLRAYWQRGRKTAAHSLTPTPQGADS